MANSFLELLWTLVAQREWGRVERKINPPAPVNAGRSSASRLTAVLVYRASAPEFLPCFQLYNLHFEDFVEYALKGLAPE